MSRDLTRFRDHAAHMATADHSPDCTDRQESWRDAEAAFRLFGEIDPGPAPECAGECIPDKERRLWHQLSDEASAYLGTPPPRSRDGRRLT